MNRVGQTLVGVLITATIMSIVSMAFLAMFRTQSQATRNIAAQGGVNDLSIGLNFLVNGQNCSNPGSGIYFLNEGSQAQVVGSGTGAYTLAMDTLRYSTGATALVNPPNTAISQMIQPYSLAPNNPTAPNPPGIGFTSIGPPTCNTSTCVFPFQMQVNFTSPNGGPPPKPLTKFVSVYTGLGTVSGSATDYSVVGMCGGGAVQTSGLYHTNLYFPGQSAGTWYTIQSGTYATTSAAPGVETPATPNFVITATGAEIKITTGVAYEFDTNNNNFALAVSLYVFQGSGSNLTAMPNSPSLVVHRWNTASEWVGDMQQIAYYWDTTPGATYTIQVTARVDCAPGPCSVAGASFQMYPVDVYVENYNW